MARVLSLGDIGQSTMIDLLTGTLQLDSGSWSTRTAAAEGEYRYLPYGAIPAFKHFGVVVEQMRLVGENTVVNLVGAASAIEALLERARLYHEDDLVELSQWFYWNADGENAKRSLILEGALRYAVQAGVSPMLRYGAMAAELAITRHPLWENTLSSLWSSGDLSCWGGKATFSSVPGTVPARIFGTDFSPYSGGTSGPIYRVWAGLRKEYEGTTNFQAVWELEDGTNGTDASDVADGSASDGYKVQVNFGTTATMAKRCSIRLDQAVGLGYDDFIGRYLVLVRCQVGGGTTCAVQMKHGYQGSMAFVPGEVVYVDNTVWRLIELGEVKMPIQGARYGAAWGALLRNLELQIWAERVSGSGVLDLDAICLIPSDRFLRLVGTQIQYSPWRKHTLYTRANDVQFAEGYELGGIVNFDAEMDVRDWYLPAGNGMLVLAGEQETQHVLTDGLQVGLQYYPRWKSFRGT